MSKRSILILTDWFIPGFKAGGPIQSVHRLVELVKQEFDISIITADRDLGESSSYTGITQDQWVHKEGYRVMYCSPDESKRVIAQELKHEVYDRYYMNSFFSIQFTIGPLLQLRNQNLLSKVILAPRGMLGEGALAIKPLKKKLFVLLFKLLGIHKKVHFHATDESEQRSIEKVLGNVRLDVITNIPISPIDDVRKNPSDEKKFVFASRVSPKKNLHLLLEYWKSVDEHRAELNIYGQSDDVAYEELCLDKISALTSVNLVGAISPSELFTKFLEHHFFVLPTMNENFGHSIIEALAHGCPAIISDQTPWNDLEEEGAGWVVGLDDHESWNRTLQKAVDLSSEEWEKMSMNALAYVKGKFDIQQIKQQYIHLFSE